MIEWITLAKDDFVDVMWIPEQYPMKIGSGFTSYVIEIRFNLILADDVWCKWVSQSIDPRHILTVLSNNNWNHWTGKSARRVL